MDVVRLFPNVKYLIKLWLKGLSMMPLLLIFLLVASIQELGTISPPLILVSLLALVILIASYAYYQSLAYEIHDDEIIVYSGFLNKSVKHVNFRNVTNMELKRTLLDRVLGIGSLSIQTAGSGSVLPEEKLAGLDNVQDVYHLLAQHLRAYRTEDQPVRKTRPTSIEGLDNREISIQMLRELRAIRTLLSQ